MESSRQIRYEERLAQRRRDRASDLGPTPLQQLEAGFPALYEVAGEYIEEHPDGRRYVVRLVDGGRSAVNLREI